jgi:hypothetical protein
LREVNRLIRVGFSAAHALVCQDEWIHRRVESITFPFANRPVYRRHISVDFTIPEGLDPAVEAVDGPGPQRPPRYYVPLSLVRRWPPLPRLDLRDPAGHPNPFLTGRQNAVLDSAALLGLAQQVSPALSAGLSLPIAQIAAAESQAEREQALAEVIDKAPPESLQGKEADAHRALGLSGVFCALARELIDHSLLWLRVDGWPEDRTIVKFSYDVPIEAKSGNWSARSFGLQPFVFEFVVPHLGDTSSYHCNVVAPAPLEVVRAEMKLEERQPADDTTADQVRHHVDSTLPRPRSDSIELFAGLAESQAKFYASGDRTGLKGNLWVAVLIQSQGLLQGALGVGLSSVAILLALMLFLAEAVKIADATAAVLLISPAVLGYLSVRPAEEALAGDFLVGLRRLIMLSGVPPVAAATAFALSDHDDSGALYLALGICTALQAALTIGIFLAYVAGNRWRKRYEAHPDSSLAPPP